MILDDGRTAVVIRYLTRTPRPCTRTVIFVDPIVLGDICRRDHTPTSLTEAILSRRGGAAGMGYCVDEPGLRTFLEWVMASHHGSCRSTEGCCV